MKYAVIRLNGRQYKVSEGEEILVDKMLDQKAEPVVLLVAGEKKVSVGKPLVKGAKVKIKVLKEEKGEKLLITKYKSKSRYRRRMGFRPIFTRILVEKISN